MREREEKKYFFLIDKTYQSYEKLRGNVSEDAFFTGNKAPN